MHRICGLRGEISPLRVQGRALVVCGAAGESKPPPVLVLLRQKYKDHKLNVIEREGTTPYCRIHGTPYFEFANLLNGESRG